jgi:hypothetical protein
VRRPRPSALALACAGVAALAGAAPAAANDAGSVTRTDGAVTATLRWDAAGFGVANPRLTVDRAGAEQAPPVADACRTGCILTTAALKVVDLDGDDEPEVLVDTFSGGAHCCLSLRLYRWTGAAYARTTIAWGDVSYALRDLDHDEVPEIVGWDPMFSSAFTAFAASSFPPMVLRWNAGTTQNVTRRFPGLVRRDLATQRRLLRKSIRRRRDVKGVLAAVVADQFLLDRGPAGLEEVHRQRRAHRVGKGYKKSLLRFLRRGGYR